MINYSAIATCITNLQREDPTTAVTVKQLYDNQFELMYITICKFLERQDVHQYEYDRAIKYLKKVEKELMTFYKDETGDTLKFKMTQEQEANEKVGYWGYNGSESSYFRLFRRYEITSPKADEDFKVAS